MARARFGDAPGIVGVGRDGVAAVVVQGDYRALVVGVEEAAGPAQRAFVPDQGLVGPGAVDVGAGDGAGAVELHRQLVAVVEEPRRRGAARHLPQPAERVVGEARGLGARRRDQPVLGVVDVGAGAVRDEVAVEVVGIGDGGRTGAGRAAILVEPVRRIAADVGAGPAPGISVVARRAAEDLRGGVVGEAEDLVAAVAGEIVAERLETAGRVVAMVGRRGPAAPRQAAGIVPGVAGDRSAAIFADEGRPVEAVMLVGEEASIGMDDADAVAIQVAPMPDRPKPS